MMRGEYWDSSWMVGEAERIIKENLPVEVTLKLVEALDLGNLLVLTGKGKDYGGLVMRLKEVVEDGLWIFGRDQSPTSYPDVVISISFKELKVFDEALREMPMGQELIDTFFLPPSDERGLDFYRYRLLGSFVSLTTAFKTKVSSFAREEDSKGAVG